MENAQIEELQVNKEILAEIQKKLEDRALLESSLDEFVPTEQSKKELVQQEGVTAQLGTKPESESAKLAESFPSVESSNTGAQAESSQEVLEKYKTETISQTGLTETKGFKKVVIYIDNENFNYVDNLGQDERNRIINEYFWDSRTKSKKELEKKARERVVMHTAAAILTFLIALPILTFVCRKSLEITVSNSVQAGENFAGLIKKNGVSLKKKDLKNLRKIGY